MPLTQTNPADEIVETATKRLLALLVKAVSEAEPDTHLQNKAAMAVQRISRSYRKPIDPREVTTAREIIARVNDLLEVAAPESRADLRHVRGVFEDIVDKFETQKIRIETGRPEVPVYGYYVTLGIDGGAGSAPNATVEG